MGIQLLGGNLADASDSSLQISLVSCGILNGSLEIHALAAVASRRHTTLRSCGA